LFLAVKKSWLTPRASVFLTGTRMPLAFLPFLRPKGGKSEIAGKVIFFTSHSVIHH
jgi:hypothetical protein